MNKSVLSQVNFSGKDLRGVELTNCDLRKSNFCESLVVGTKFCGSMIDSDVISSMKNEQLRQCDITGCNLSGIKMNKMDLSFVNFNGCDLRGVDFSNSNLDHSTFRGALLDDSALVSAGAVELAKANLFGVVFFGDLCRCNLEGTNLVGAVFKGAVKGANFRGSVLNRVNWSGVPVDFDLIRWRMDSEPVFAKKNSLSGLTLCTVKGQEMPDKSWNFSGCTICSGSDLSGCDLGDSNFSGVTLSGVNLSGVNFSTAILTGCNLSGCDFTETQLPKDLTNVNLSGVDLSNRDFTKTTLVGCNLSGCNLSGANLSGANLSGCNLCGANLYGTTVTDSDFTAATLVDVTFPVDLTCPHGCDSAGTMLKFGEPGCNRNTPSDEYSYQGTFYAVCKHHSSSTWKF